MSARKSVVEALVFLAFLVSCIPKTAPLTDTPPPAERAPLTATGAPAATEAPFAPTRPSPTLAPIVARLHCPDCAQEGKAIDLLDRPVTGDDPEGGPVVVGQAQHGDAVHILVRGRRGYRLARVQVMGTGLTGWVYPEYVVAP